MSSRACRRTAPPCHPEPGEGRRRHVILSVSKDGHATVQAPRELSLRTVDRDVIERSMKSYWVYILRCADESYYVGVTSRVDERVAEHNAGGNPFAYTYIRRPVKLVYEQSFANVDDAIAAEKRIKGWSRAKKDALICGDWNAIRRLAAGRGASSHARPSTGSG